jgi:hypothetical protein
MAAGVAVPVLKPGRYPGRAGPVVRLRAGSGPGSISDATALCDRRPVAYPRRRRRFISVHFSRAGPGRAGPGRALGGDPVTGDSFQGDSVWPEEETGGARPGRRVWRRGVVGAGALVGSPR